MKEIELMILGSVIGEDQFERVSFLEPLDFNNYDGFNCRKYWQKILSSKAETMALMNLMLKTDDPSERNVYFQLASFSAQMNLERYALKLVELRLTTLFCRLLLDLSTTSKDSVEIGMVNDYVVAMAGDGTDIFMASETFIDYLGVNASSHTKSRVAAFLNYKDERIKKIKSVIK